MQAKRYFIQKSFFIRILVSASAFYGQPLDQYDPNERNKNKNVKSFTIIKETKKAATVFT